MELHLLVPLRLKQYRRKACLTQHALARLLHMNSAAYRNVERGTRVFSAAAPGDMKLVSDFCAALQLSIAGFLTGSDNTEPGEAALLQLHWDLICSEMEVIADIKETVTLLQAATEQLRKDVGL